MSTAVGNARVRRAGGFGPRLRVRLIAATLVLAVVCGGAYAWLRDSSLVAVKQVYISGLSSSDEAKIRTALKAAAMDMTTLHVRHEQLDAAVKPFPSVKSLTVTADFPHDLSIEVVERHPVAALETEGGRIAVGAGGLIMRGLRADASLPTVRAKSTGAGGRLTDERALAAVAVLAAAPRDLRERTMFAFYAKRGLTLHLEDGPRLIFGSERGSAAKWAAAARVLADRRAAGASYLDLRVPERVAAGGLPTPTPTVGAIATAEVTAAATPLVTPAATQAAAAAGAPVTNPQP